MTDFTGQQFGTYKLLRLLGQGGFADVYLGEHIHLKTRAAIKILHLRMAQDTETIFRTEARTIAHLEHPHIIRVLDFDIEEHIPFLVMSYAPHGSLRSQHPNGTIVPLATVINYVGQVADALGYAHEQKVIHRDVKPANMLLGKQGEILLSDFGVALIEQSSDYRSGRNVAGTIAYMAPEQLQGKPGAASDQYALAISTYEWLCGTRPFKGSFMEIYSQHMASTPAPIATYNPALSKEIEDVLLQALAKNPQDRFQDIREFAHALEAVYEKEKGEQEATTIKKQEGTRITNNTAILAASLDESDLSAYQEDSESINIPPSAPIIEAPTTHTLVQQANNIDRNRVTDQTGTNIFKDTRQQSPRKLTRNLIIGCIGAILIIALCTTILFHFPDNKATGQTGNQATASIPVPTQNTTNTQNTPHTQNTPTRIVKNTPAPKPSPTPKSTQNPTPTAPPITQPAPILQPTPTAAATPTPTANLPTPVGVDNQPQSGSLITCSGTLNGNWTKYTSTNHGYIGSANTGSQSSCNGTFDYVLTPSNATATFFKNQSIPNGSSNVDVWVYVPTINAGARATYTIEFNTGSSITLHLDQNNYSYWNLLQTVAIPSGATTISVILSSDDSNFYLAEDAMAIYFH